MYTYITCSIRFSFVAVNFFLFVIFIKNYKTVVCFII